ncbi:MAG: DUF1385 domain-containing protein [Deltaproteobacteria bacterium]|nr:DUF1385 domain-containing protein [Deltaproteobacteria bacterium]
MRCFGTSLTDTELKVGGQAVLEGVMMRSPSALAVAVRKANGEVAIKETPWKSLSGKLPWLSLPFIRGSLVLFEALVNGLDALTFSANQALDDEDEEEMGFWVMGLTIAVAIGLGLLLFVVAPHYLSLLIGRVSPVPFGVASLAFHVIDGIFKLAFFIAYIWLISRVKEIGRLFEYHGAEHKSIYTYEAGQELTIENARAHTTLHPRCGTAFILVVLMISILFFTIIFPLISLNGREGGWALQVLYVAVKIVLMLPIAGVAYELNRYASKHMDRALLKAAIMPGLWIQKLTTREPSDDQIEIALIALKRTLSIESAQNAS